MSDHRICHLASEHANLEILELQDRVRDLEADVAVYAMYFKATLHALHHVTAERARSRSRERESRRSLAPISRDSKRWAA